MKQVKKISSQAQVAKLIKEELKVKFPSIKFSVRSESFAGGDAVSVSWFDGVTTKQVNEIINKYQYGHFNGMEDIYEYSNKQDFPQVKYVSSSRTLSYTATKQVVDKIKEKYGVEVEVKKEYSDYYKMDVVRLGRDEYLEDFQCYKNNLVHRESYSINFIQN